MVLVVETRNPKTRKRGRYPMEIGQGGQQEFWRGRQQMQKLVQRYVYVSWKSIDRKVWIDLGGGGLAQNKGYLCLRNCLGMGEKRRSVVA